MEVMQDGDSPQYTVEAREFYSEVFQQRLTRQGTERIWPDNNHDVSPIDPIYSWKPRGKFTANCQKTSKIPCNVSYDRETMRRFCVKALDMTKLCFQADGGRTFPVLVLDLLQTV